MKEEYVTIRKDIPMEFNELKLLKYEGDRIKCVENGIVIPPFEILIHPTAKCNLKCSWCIGQNITEDKNEPINNVLTADDNLMNLAHSIISYKKEVEIDNQKKIFGVERVSFSGITGDPMMAQRQLIPVLDELHSNNIQTGMFTNGLLINKNNIDTISKMDYILISVDAGNSDTYNKMKNNGKSSNYFEQLMKNIERLNDYKIANDRSIEVNVGFVLNQYNYTELYSLAENLKSIGVSNLRIKTDISRKLLIDSKLFDQVEEQYDLIRKNLEDECFKLVELHRIFNSEDRERYFSKCLINKLYANVSSDGYVYACNYHPAIRGIKFGNVTEKPFNIIWEQANKDFDISKCPRTCDPFKNRANNMLNSYLNNESYKNKVDEYLETI